jgi:RNA polymerase sigma factor (sigma-70 family)
LEASALTHASRRGLLARRSPLLKLQGDEKLIAMARSGNASAFEMIVDRYQGRLLGFCRQMLGSTEDAEDILQEVFVNAYRAMLADEREINLRPWLYRIARNRCLNHLRKPTADAQESMDMVPEVEAASTAEKVHNREEFRQIISDVNKLPETQRSALLLREMEALSYEEIATAMDTTVPSVKSLLVRARISLAEASQARLLTCGEVRVELSEAAEGLTKVSAPVRRHIRECDECADFRKQVRSNEKMLAALFPVAPLLAFKGFIASKLGLGGASAGSSAAASAAGGAAGAGAVGSGAAAALGGGGGALGGIGAIGGAIGTKAVAGAVAAAVLTAGAVEVKQQSTAPVNPPAPVPHHIAVAEPGGVEPAAGPSISTARATTVLPKEDVASAIEAQAPVAISTATNSEEAPAEVEPAIGAEEEVAIGPEEAEEVAGQSSATADGTGGVSPTEGITPASPSGGVTPGAHSGTGTVVVTVGGTPPPPTTPPATTTPPPAAPPVESTPPPAETVAPPAEAPAEAPIVLPVPVEITP